MSSFPETGRVIQAGRFPTDADGDALAKCWIVPIETPTQLSMSKDWCQAVLAHTMSDKEVGDAHGFRSLLLSLKKTTRPNRLWKEKTMTQSCLSSCGCPRCLCWTRLKFFFSSRPVFVVRQGRHKAGLGRADLARLADNKACRFSIATSFKMTLLLRKGQAEAATEAASSHVRLFHQLSGIFFFPLR